MQLLLIILGVILMCHGSFFIGLFLIVLGAML